MKKEVKAPSDIIAVHDELYGKIFNKFFADHPPIVCPPFMIPAFGLMFSDGIAPTYSFHPCIIGPKSILPRCYNLLKDNNRELKFSPVYKSGNAENWNEELTLKYLLTGTPDSLSVSLTPKRPGKGHVINIVSFFNVKEPLFYDAGVSSREQSDDFKWKITMKSLSVDKEAPTFKPNGINMSAYKKILDLNTGKEIDSIPELEPEVKAQPVNF